MPSFTKLEMLKELATILLFEADHITLGAGAKVAAAFIGFETGEHEYCFESPTKVDLSRFSISDSFKRGFDYAFEPSVLNTLGEHEVQDLVVFMDGTPRVGGVSSGGETHKFMTSEGLCRCVADAVFARWKLEWDPLGAGSYDFTPRELALLANMTEGAVRNAIADKSDAGIRTVPGSKNPVKISHDEAMRWLSARRAFIPMPKGVKDDKLLVESLKKADTAAALGKLISRIASVSASADKFEDLDFGSWCDGSFQYDKNQAIRLAQRLEIDAPLFVGKALEVSMRRDSI
jgi:hypothetical protein